MLVTRTWYLEVNSVPLATPAWECPNLSPLLDDPALRGDDLVLPTAEGARAFVRRRTVTIVTLALDVVGHVDWNGGAVAEADQFEQLNIHLAYLKANMGLASQTGDGTVQAVMHRGDLPSLTADVHFLGFKGTATRGPRMLRTTFDLSIPQWWEESGS